ncbi:MAG: tetratricopeptide repeat protein, partial [Gammaproteobacteria bacterium]|nr:tetratricopeptide repeat protein [Gammaproteobacteria bacterium]
CNASAPTTASLTPMSTAAPRESVLSAIGVPTLPLVLVILSLLCSAVVFAADASAIRTNRCLDEIDLVTRYYDSGDLEGTRERLKKLETSCSHVPQLHHNLGVLAAAEFAWNDAITYFEQSLALDERAAMTQQSLASIYQYKASRAYKKALNLSEKIKLPVLTMQSSTLTNQCRSDIALPTPQPEVLIQASLNLAPPTNQSADLTSPETLPATLPDTEQLLDAVRYDVYSWWTALQEQDDDALPAHYLRPDAAVVRHQQGNRYSWNSLTIDIEFVDQIALVSITYPPVSSATPAPKSPTLTQRTRQHDLLLVMKEHDHMWKIVREEQRQK